MMDDYIPVPFPLRFDALDQVLKAGVNYQVESTDWQGKPFLTELSFENGRYILLIDKSKHSFSSLELAVLTLLGGQGKLVMGGSSSAERQN